MQSHARLLGRPDKWLLGEAKDNRKRLRERLKSRTNKFENNQLSDRPNDRPRIIERPKAKWINNWDQRLGKAIRDRTSNRTLNQTIENDCSAKLRIIANKWPNTRTITITSTIKQVLEQVRVLDQRLEVWNRSGTSSRPRRPDTQEVDVGR